MPWLDVIWTRENRRHIGEHGIKAREVEEVLREPSSEGVSRTSGMPVVFGYTKGGRWLCVVYARIDEITVYPITAYEVED